MHEGDIEEVMLEFAALIPTYMLRQHGLELRDAGAAIRAGPGYRAEKQENRDMLKLI
jgi:hypothetical protein